MQPALPTLLAEVAKNMIAQLVPDGEVASKADMEAVTSVCMMGVYRDGTEDPRAILRGVSDQLITHLAKNLGKARGHKALAKVSQFFLLEWCYRNGYMDEDWRWEWVSKDEGKLSFFTNIPLEMIPLPSD